MVGGGNRRDEGSFTVSSTNVFAALVKKKRSDKEKGTTKGSKSSSKAGKSKAAEEKLVYWAPAPLTVKSWADVEDEDDDDYYATTAPPQAVWGSSGLTKAKETKKPDPVEESESEDDLLDEGDDDVEEEAVHETEVQEQAEPVVTKPVEVSQAHKETDRQLSKKERKKKELAELEAILADFGVNPKEKSENEPSERSKEGQLNRDAENKDIVAPAESKSARKKKKNDKASKESKAMVKHCLEVMFVRSNLANSDGNLVLLPKVVFDDKENQHRTLSIILPLLEGEITFSTGYGEEYTFLLRLLSDRLGYFICVSVSSSKISKGSRAAIVKR